MCQKICIFAQNAGMSLSMTLILCFLASVCPPHVRLHGGPSASPCLMPFSGEQRVFLYESPDPQLSCNAECGICQRPVSALQPLLCCPLFQNTVLRVPCKCCFAGPHLPNTSGRCSRLKKSVQAQDK